MGFEGSSVILLLFVAVLNINAWTVVPGERSVVSKNGNTRSVSKYSFYRDSENKTGELNRGDFDMLLKDIKAHNNEHRDSNDGYRIYVKRKFKSGRPPIRLRTETVETVSSPVDARYVYSASSGKNNEDVSAVDGPASSRVVSSSTVISSPQKSKVYVLKMESNGAKVHPQFNIGSSSSKLNVVSIPLVRAREIREGFNSAQNSDQSSSSEISGHIVPQVKGHSEENPITKEPEVVSFEDLTRFLKLQQETDNSPDVGPSVVELEDHAKSDLVHGQVLFSTPLQANPSHNNDIHSLKADEVIHSIKSYLKLRQDDNDAGRLRSQFDYPSSLNVISIPLVRTRPITNNGDSEENISEEPKVDNINDQLRVWQIVQESHKSPVARPFIVEHKDIDNSDVINGQVILPFAKEPEVIHDSTRPWDLKQANEKSPVVGPSVLELEGHDGSDLVHRSILFTSPSQVKPSQSDDKHALQGDEVIKLIKSYLVKMRQNGDDVPLSSLKVISIPLVRARPITNTGDSEENLIAKEPIVDNINDLLRPQKIEQENYQSPVARPFNVEHKDLNNSDVVNEQVTFTSPSQVKPIDDKYSIQGNEVIDLIKSYLVKMRLEKGDQAPSYLNVIPIPLVRTRPITNNSHSEENLSNEPKVDKINNLLRPSDLEQENEKSPVVSEVNKDLDTAGYPSSSSNVISIPLVSVRTITNDDQDKNPKSAEVDYSDYSTTSWEHEQENEKSPVTVSSVVELRDSDLGDAEHGQPRNREAGYVDYDDGLTTSWEHEQKNEKSLGTVPSVVELRDSDLGDAEHGQPRNRETGYVDYGDGFTTSWEHEQEKENSAIADLSVVEDKESNNSDLVDDQEQNRGEEGQKNRKNPVTNTSVVEHKEFDNSDLVDVLEQNLGEEYGDYSDVYTTSFEHELENAKSPVVVPSSVVKKDLSTSSPSQTLPSHSDEKHALKEGEINNVKNDGVRNRFAIKTVNLPELISNFFEFRPHNQVNENQISSILIHNINPDAVEIGASEIHVPVQIDCFNHPELYLQLLHNSEDQLNGCVSLDDQGTITFLFNLVRQLQQRPNQNNEKLIQLIKKIIEQQSRSQHSASQNIQLIKFILYLYNLQQQNPNQNIQTIINSNQHLINHWVHQNPNSNIQIPDSKITQIIIELLEKLNNLNQQQPNEKTGFIINILQNFANQFKHNHNVQIDHSQGSYILVLLQNLINQQWKAQNPAIVELIQQIKFNLEQLINQSSPETEVQKPNHIIQAIIDIISNLNENKLPKPHNTNENLPNKENEPTVEDLKVIIELINLDHIEKVLNALLQLQHSNPDDQAAISKWLVVFHSIFEIFEERQYQNIDKQNFVMQLAWFLERPDRQIVFNLLQQKWFQYILVQLNNNNLNVLNNPEWTPYLQIWLIQLKNLKPDNNSPILPDNPNDVEPDHEEVPTVEDLNVIIQLLTIDHIREILHSLLRLQHSQPYDVPSEWLKVFHSIFEIFKERQNQNIDQQNVITQLAWFLAKPERKVVLDLLQQNWFQFIIEQLKNKNFNIVKNPHFSRYLQIWLIKLKNVKPNNNNPIQPDNSNNVQPDYEKVPSIEDLKVIIEMINLDHIEKVLNALLQLQHSNPDDQAAISKWLVVFHSIFEIFEERQYQNVDKQNIITQLVWFLARPDRHIVLDLLQQKWFQYIIEQLNNNNLNVLNNPEWTPYLQIWLMQLKNVKPDNNSPIKPDNPNKVEPDHGNNPTVQDFNVIINVFTLDHIRAILNKLEQILYIQNNDVAKWREIFRLIFEVFKIREDLNIDKQNAVAQIAWFSANPIRRYVLNLLQQQWLQQIMVELKNNNLRVLKKPQWAPYLQIWLVQLEEVKHQGIIIDHNNNSPPDYNPKQPLIGQGTIQLKDSLAIMDLLISHIRNARNGFCQKRVLDSLAGYLQQQEYSSLMINSLVYKYSKLMDTIIQNRQHIYSQCH